MLKNPFLDTAASKFGHVCEPVTYQVTKRPLRTKYIEAKTNKSTDNKMRLINTSKSYKKSIFKSFSQHKFKTESKMRRLLSDDPKAFYKLFNKKQNNLANNVNVPPIDTFFNYFSDFSFYFLF